MERVGIAFKSTLTPDEVFARYIRPLRAALEAAQAGIYSNYLRQVDEHDAGEPDEHLLMFQVRDFEQGLHLLRMKLQEVGTPPNTTLHNLAASDPMY
jgi:hypothetical protein